MVSRTFRISALDLGMRLSCRGKQTQQATTKRKEETCLLACLEGGGTFDPWNHTRLGTDVYAG